jgi:hypothetical protein
MRSQPSEIRGGVISGTRLCSPTAPSTTMASTSPVHFAAITAASPVSCATGTKHASRTLNPRSARIRAATNPSPPLLPGPHSTAIRAPRFTIFAASSATAVPARSISVRLVMPLAMASASAWRISSAVSSACSCITIIPKSLFFTQFAYFLRCYLLRSPLHAVPMV